MSNSPSPAPAGAESAPARNPTDVLDMQWEGDPGLPPDASAEDDGEDHQDPEPAEIEPEAPEGEDGETSEGEGQENEEPVDDATEPEAEPKSSDDEETGTRMHRLRDGSQVSLSDLKKGYGDYQEFTQRVWPQIQQERARFQQDQQAFAAQQQQFQPILAQVATILQGQIVQRPDSSLRQSDPIEYFTQLDLHNESVDRLHQVNQAQAEQQQAAQRQQEAQHKAYLQDQQIRLLQAMPELQDTAKAQAFNADFQEVGRVAGFTPEELGQVYDHRLFKLAQLAARGLKAMRAEGQTKQVTANKAQIAAKKVADKPPVAPPAARQSAGIREQAQSRGSLERLKKTGSAADAEDFLSRFA